MTTLSPARRARRSKHQYRFRSLRRLRRDVPAMASLIFLVLLVAFAIVGPYLARYGPNEQVLVDRFQGPSGTYWLGTDDLGRDLFSRLADGSRVSLAAAAQAVAVAAMLGIPFGLVAGLVSGVVDKLLTAFANALLSIPGLLLAMAIVGALGPGLTNAMLAVGLIISPRFYRVARSAAFSVRGEIYVEACTAIGCSPARIVWRHVLPNTSGPLLVQTSFAIGMAIIAEASLSFLGLGAQPPQGSWGTMISDAFRMIYHSRWAVYPPSILITLTILCFSVLGDGLRDALGRERSA